MTLIPFKALPKITSFKGEYAWLSNMLDCDGITLDGVNYPSTEAAYQAAKTGYHNLRKPFEQMNGYDAKKAGRKLPMRADWDDVKLQVMLDLLRQKFDPANNPDLADKLLATGGAELVEGNYWNDTFWGFSLQTNQGENWLGRLLEHVRQELRLKRLLDADKPDEITQELKDFAIREGLFAQDEKALGKPLKRSIQ